MRKTDRYTVPFPPAIPPEPAVYRDRFREFPLWYRWYLRFLTVITGTTIEQIVRRQDLNELKRTLTHQVPEIVDCSVPALLPGFHSRLRILESQRRRIAAAVREITRNSGGRFLIHALSHLAPDIHRKLEEASRIPETLLESTGTSLAVAQEAVQTHLSAEMEARIPRIDPILRPVWTSVHALNVLLKFDLTPLFPQAQGMPGTRIPLRVVRTPVQELHQMLHMVQRHRRRTATELAWEFVQRTARLNPGPPGAIWSTVDEFCTTVPLEDLTRLAWDEPYLEIRSLSLRAEWWEPFRQAWLSRALDQVGGELFAYRTEQVKESLSRSFMIDRSPPSWLPSELYPATLGYVLLLSGSEFFHDTRRVVTQLVIDGVFHHLDTRNALHQAALQIDQALERLTTLLGDGESRGTLGEELHRIRQRSSNSAIVRRRLVGLYEKHRRRIRTSLEEIMESLETGGALVGRTLHCVETAFEYQGLRTQSFSGEYKSIELLTTVGDAWQPLGQRLRGLYRVESGS